MSLFCRRLGPVQATKSTQSIISRLLCKACFPIFPLALLQNLPSLICKCSAHQLLPLKSIKVIIHSHVTQCAQYKMFSLFYFHNILTKISNFFHVTIKPISRWVHTWSFSPTPFEIERAIVCILAPQISWFPMV